MVLTLPLGKYISNPQSSRWKTAGPAQNPPSPACKPWSPSAKIARRSHSFARLHDKSHRSPTSAGRCRQVTDLPRIREAEPLRRAAEESNVRHTSVCRPGFDKLKLVGHQTDPLLNNRW